MVNSTQNSDQNQVQFELQLERHCEDNSEGSSEESSLPSYFEGLNPEQLKGASHLDGPILILAGAGSGKTRVLTHRIVHLVKAHGVHPKNILSVTFTNKASREMKDRLERLLGPQARYLWASTFHSTALRILRRHAQLLQYRYDFVVYDTQDTKGLMKGLLKELKIDEKKYPPQFFLKAIDRAKNNYILSSEYINHHSGSIESMIGDVYDKYQRLLIQSNAMDFGDLLVNAVRLFKEKPEVLNMYQAHLKYLLVDEFQDTNKVQYMLIRMLAAPQNNLLMVGDDDQSIYAFRGATIQNILNFENDFPETEIVKLEQNYRSTAKILESANGVISKNSERKPKKLWTASDGGDGVVTYAGGDEGDEAYFIAQEIDRLKKEGRPLDQIAIFYRTNAQSRAIEDALMQKAIPYQIYGGLKFYDRKEIKDILSYLRLIANDADRQAFLRIVNTPTRGIGPRAVLNVAEAAKENGTSLFESARDIGITHKSVRAFVEMIDGFREAAKSIPLYELVDRVIEESSYAPKLREIKDITAQSRLENLRELSSIAVTMSNQEESPLEDLRLFLDRVSLTSSEELPVEDARNEVDEKKDKVPPVTVSLMTLHIAKGLEFPIVFFTGMEEGLMPHHKSTDDSFGVSEERRLCYVGMTRAMEKLYLTRARRRGMFSAGGGFGFSSGSREPSRFAFDVPASCFAENLVTGGSSDFFETGPVVEFEGEYSEESRNESWEEDREKPYTKGKKLWASGTSKKSKTKDKPKIKGKITANLRKRMKQMGASSLVKTADDMGGNAADDKAFAALTTAAFTDLVPGTEVVHRTFGSGVIEKVEEHPSGKAEKGKLVVLFDSFDVPKKLLFRHAKLALC